MVGSCPYRLPTANRTSKERTGVGPRPLASPHSVPLEWRSIWLRGNNRNDPGKFAAIGLLVVDVQRGLLPEQVVAGELLAVFQIAIQKSLGVSASLCRLTIELEPKR